MMIALLTFVTRAPPFSVRAGLAIVVPTALTIQHVVCWHLAFAAHALHEFHHTREPPNSDLFPRAIIGNDLVELALGHSLSLCAIR